MRETTQEAEVYGAVTVCDKSTVWVYIGCIRVLWALRQSKSKFSEYMIFWSPPYPGFYELLLSILYPQDQAA